MAKDIITSNDLIVELTAAIVEAYVSYNPVQAADLPAVIASVAKSVRQIGQGSEQPVPGAQKPAVPIRKSITQDYLISLEDGRPYRTLKRHLSTLGLTPDGYRAKWNLPEDYPMVASTYSARRSELAKKLGLGRKPGIKRGGRAKVKA
ncbi:MucR family transcriptional regulator [Mesorhizobium retamae]|uniref:MucR family transcriptional regulator n=1 Tax=Mesorhizobium retamae TaxID=2912854 RepID=A0ABS9QLW1_9HYPH|nr:MucR family transcriptional regulator [Mesorhizobium sp. IRAMC:0171]MCG7508435.1 MucR family transcriptional regulator [Mesorhizobium sp. IRAMC:0171]